MPRKTVMPNPSFDITTSFYFSVHDHERCWVLNSFKIRVKGLLDCACARCSQAPGGASNTPCSICEGSRIRKVHAPSLPTQLKYLRREVRRKRTCSDNAPLPQLRCPFRNVKNEKQCNGLYASPPQGCTQHCCNRNCGVPMRPVNHLFSSVSTYSIKKHVASRRWLGFDASKSTVMRCRWSALAWI